MKNTFSLSACLICLLSLINCKATKNEIHVPEHSVHDGYSELQDTALLNLIHSKIKEYPNDTQFSLAVIKKGIPYYYGIENNNGQANKLRNNNKVFEIGSITKVFTTHLLIKSIQAGELKLDDQLGELIDINQNDSEKISLQQLASHSSGLPVMPDSFWDSGYDEQNPYIDFGKDDLISYLESEISVDTALVNKFNYSNIGMSILGHILEEIHQKKYETLLQEMIFTPLDMNNTSLDRLSMQDRLVTGLKLDGSQGQNWDLEAVKPAGGIYSTSEDLVKYFQACFQVDNKEFDFQVQPITKRNKSMDQALGWMIINSKSGDKYYCHAGGTGAYSTMAVMNKTSKNAIILLSNIETEDSSIDLFAFKLMKELNSLE